MNRNRFARPTQSKSIINVLDDIFNSSLSDFVRQDFSFNKPSVNIIENKDDFQIQLAAPGLNKEDFKIKVDKDQLIVKAEIEDKTESTKENFRRREFNFNSFSRSFHLTDKINSDSISADYKDGILTIKLEKREEAKEKAPRTIEIL